MDIIGSNSYLLEVPVGRVREEEEAWDEEDGEGGGGDGHPVPAGDGAKGVSEKGAFQRIGYNLLFVIVIITTVQMCYLRPRVGCVIARPSRLWPRKGPTLSSVF